MTLAVLLPQTASRFLGYAIPVKTGHCDAIGDAVSYDTRYHWVFVNPRIALDRESFCLPKIKKPSKYHSDTKGLWRTRNGAERRIPGNR